MKLDDTVVLGSLDALSRADDRCVADLASTILNRRVRRCIEIRERIKEKLGSQDMRPVQEVWDESFANTTLR